MTKTLERLSRALAMTTLVLFAAPASSAAEEASAHEEDAPASSAAREDAPPMPVDGVAVAKSLFDAGRFREALAVLRILLKDGDRSTDVLFLTGLSAIEAARRLPEDAEAEQEALFDVAISALHAALVDRPDLVRVRLELARAFFYKGEDGLARGHFERVLAGDVPEEVKTNVQRFLLQIRARRRWSAYLGTAVAPDTNVTGASGESVVYVNYLGQTLPFVLDNPREVTSGVGAMVWTGVEYQHPLGDRLRLRAGVDAFRKEYAGGDFDEMNLSLQAGPRWLVNRRTEASLLGNVRRRWAGGAISSDAVGARVEAYHRLTPLISVNSRVSWTRRDYENSDYGDGPLVNLTLGGTWTLSPVVRANAAVGYSRERPERELDHSQSRRLRGGLSVALPRGFTAGGSVQLRWTDFKGDSNIYALDHNVPREDLTRTFSLSLFKRDFTLYGFSPQVVVTHEERTTNSQTLDYERTYGEVRFVRQF